LQCVAVCRSVLQSVAVWLQHFSAVSFAVKACLLQYVLASFALKPPLLPGDAVCCSVFKGV